MSAWSKMAPAANREASVMTKNGRVTSGIDSTGPEEKAALRVLNAHCWRSVQAQG